MLSEYARRCGSTEPRGSYNRRATATPAAAMNGSSSAPPTETHYVRLIAHRDTPTDAVGSVEVRVVRSADGPLALKYVIAGDLGRVRVPPRARKSVAERLWQHTCCEMFVRRTSFAGYHELNFAPSGEWAAYRFE